MLAFCCLVADALLKHKADVNLSGPNGSPIVLAASSDNEELLEKLLDSGIHGPLDCAMHVAAKAGNYKIIQLLLLKGADFFSKVELMKGYVLKLPCT